MAKARPFTDLDQALYEQVLDRVSAHELIPFVTPERVERMVQVVTRRLSSVTVLFENLWDSHNRAAILRTTEGLGVSSAHVVEDHQRYKHHRAITHGAEQWLELHRHSNIKEALPALRSKGFLLCAADVGEGCIPVTSIKADQPIAVLLGSEKRGLSEQAREASDVRFSIPMAGFTGSFNVSVSAAIGLWEVCKTRRAYLGRTGDLDVEQATKLAIDWLETRTSAGKRIQQVKTARPKPETPL